MACAEKPSMPNLPYEDFAEYYLPNFYKPPVTIAIGDKELKVSKDLLCQHSSYFTAMFDGHFKESKEQLAVMAEIEGVVSVRSFKILLQWIHTGHIRFRDEEPEVQVTAAIEFARLADMLGLKDTEPHVAEIVSNAILMDCASATIENYVNTHIRYITSTHIRDAACLPRGHLIRHHLARAAVKPYLSAGEFKFAQESQDVPEFALDLLRETRPAIRSIKVTNKHAYFRDPIGGGGCTLR
ncbi:hypothetical protein BJY01DRAFT_136944 [Aspergillus pseudoustus]|uniref:BTB domain-containing protein n=1 Tax=Aspergillus pseudoustus TaxID=1810923 RepID=A0ABR4KY83_9EURO